MQLVTGVEDAIIKFALMRGRELKSDYPAIYRPAFPFALMRGRELK